MVILSLDRGVAVRFRAKALGSGTRLATKEDATEIEISR
jgi:hypothetical protein